MTCLRQNHWSRSERSPHRGLYFPPNCSHRRHKVSVSVCLYSSKPMWPTGHNAWFVHTTSKWWIQSFAALMDWCKILWGSSGITTPLTRTSHISLNLFLLDVLLLSFQEYSGRTIHIVVWPQLVLQAWERHVISVDWCHCLHKRDCDINCISIHIMAHRLWS